MYSAGLKQTYRIPLQVLSPGSILATQGAGGQQILHVIHTIPSVSMPSKVGQLQTIPVVVQSLPVVYTTMPTDGVATAAITVPLIGSDGRSEGSGECFQEDTTMVVLVFISVFSLTLCSCSTFSFLFLQISLQQPV